MIRVLTARILFVGALGSFLLLPAAAGSDSSPFGIGQACAQGSCKPKINWVCSSSNGNDWAAHKWIGA